MKILGTNFRFNATNYYIIIYCNYFLNQILNSSFSVELAEKIENLQTHHYRRGLYFVSKSYFITILKDFYGLVYIPTIFQERIDGTLFEFKHPTFLEDLI